MMLPPWYRKPALSDDLDDQTLPRLLPPAALCRVLGKFKKSCGKKNVKSKTVTPQHDLKLTTGIVNNINKQISSPEHGANAIIIKSTITILIRISQWY
jgi:hypothetical protein